MFWLVCAAGAGCLCVLVDCYFGWRVGLAVGLARRQIAKTDESFFALRLTLAEVLTKKAEMRGFGEKKMDNAELEALRKETHSLVKSVQKNAPAEYQDMIRAKQESGDILK